MIHEKNAFAFCQQKTYYMKNILLGLNMQGNDNYYTNGISKCQDSVRFDGKEKYPDKVMDWVAKSNRPRRSI